MLTRAAVDVTFPAMVQAGPTGYRLPLASMCTSWSATAVSPGPTVVAIPASSPAVPGHRHPVPAPGGQPAVGEQPEQDRHQHDDQGPAQEQHRHPAQRQRPVVQPVVQHGVVAGGVRGEQQQGQQQPADRVGRPPGRQQDPHRRTGQRDRQGDQPVGHRAAGAALVQCRRTHRVDQAGAEREQAEQDRQRRRNPPPAEDLAHREHHLGRPYRVRSTLRPGRSGNVTSTRRPVQRSAVAGLTMWMPRSCRSSDVRAASTPYGWAAASYQQSRQRARAQEHHGQRAGRDATRPRSTALADRRREIPPGWLPHGSR